MSFKTIRTVFVFSLLVFAFGVLLVLNVNTGSVSISPGEILRIILAGGSDGSKAANVIWKIRLPRLLAAAVLGGALSVSGFLLQTFFRNPIAGPYVLGISNGAKLLVGITMVWIMISSISNAVTNFLISFADEANIANLHAWSMGSFSAISWPNLHIASAVIFVSFICAFLLSKPISAFQLGENYAHSMGVNVKLFRIALISLSSLLSAAVTALSPFRISRSCFSVFQSPSSLSRDLFCWAVCSAWAATSSPGLPSPPVRSASAM